MNIVTQIKENNSPDSTAFISDHLSLSFGQLFQHVAELSSAFQKWSAFRHDSKIRIGVKAPNGLGYIFIALSVIEAGACFVPIPDELTPHEVDQLIKTTGLHGVVSQSHQVSELALPLGLGFLELTLPPAIREDFPEKEFAQLNPAFIRFSSGTTSHSKGVVLSHESLFSRILNANTGLQLQQGERVLWTLPMAHHFAVSIILYLYQGVTTVIENSHTPHHIYEAAKTHRANLLYGSPFHYAQLAQLKEAEPLKHLRLAVSTAGPLSQEVSKAFSKRYSIHLVNALGIIEVGLPVLNLEHSDDLPEAIGKPLSCFEWRTRNTDPNGCGELELRGAGMFDAYLSPWQTRAEVTSDGWFSTGDIVKEVLPNTLILMGRSKSVINVGGLKVFPEEVETVLNNHPLIKKSKVYAQKHPIIGTIPICDYIAEKSDQLPDQKALRDFCNQYLSHYKAPSFFKPVESIELTASGKIKRHTQHIS